MVEKLLQVLVFAKLPGLHGFRKTSSVSETVFIVIVSKTCNYTFLHHSHQHPFCFCLPAGKNIDISICFGLVVVYCSTGPVFARAYGRRMLGTIARRTLGNNDSRGRCNRMHFLLCKLHISGHLSIWLSGSREEAPGLLGGLTSTNSKRGSTSSFSLRDIEAQQHTGDEPMFQHWQGKRLYPSWKVTN